MDKKKYKNQRTSASFMQTCRHIELINIDLHSLWTISLLPASKSSELLPIKPYIILHPLLSLASPRFQVSAPQIPRYPKQRQGAIGIVRSDAQRGLLSLWHSQKSFVPALDHFPGTDPGATIHAGNHAVPTGWYLMISANIGKNMEKPY